MRQFHKIFLSQHVRLIICVELIRIMREMLIKSSHKIIFCNIVKLICFDLESLLLIH